MKKVTLQSVITDKNEFRPATINGGIATLMVTRVNDHLFRIHSVPSAGSPVKEITGEEVLMIVAEFTK